MSLAIGVVKCPNDDQKVIFEPTPLCLPRRSGMKAGAFWDLCVVGSVPPRLPPKLRNEPNFIQNMLSFNY